MSRNHHDSGPGFRFADWYQRNMDTSRRGIWIPQGFPWPVLRQEEGGATQLSPRSLPSGASRECMNRAANLGCFATGQTGLDGAVMCLGLAFVPRDLTAEEHDQASQVQAGLRAHHITKVGLTALCRRLRVLVHQMETAARGSGPKGPTDGLPAEVALGPDELYGMFLEMFWNLADLGQSDAHGNLLGLIQDHLETHFPYWDWEQMDWRSSSPLAASHLPLFYQTLTRWVAQLDPGVYDGTYPVYPSIPASQARLQRLCAEEAYARPVHCHALLPAGCYVSHEAYLAGHCGSPAYRLASLEERGFRCSETVADYRVMQCRDDDGLHKVTHALPVITHPAPDHQARVLAAFREELSRVQHGRTDAFTPDLIQRVVPTVLVRAARSMLQAARSQNGQLTRHALDCFTLLDYTALECMRAHSSASSATETPPWRQLYSSVMQFSFFRARFGPTIPSLPNLLAQCSLACVPWSHVRQAFWREFLVRTCRALLPTMADGAALHDLKRHLEHQAMDSVRLFLLLLALTGAQDRPSAKLERYRRQGGLASSTEQGAVGQTIARILGCETMEDAMLLMGLVPLNTEARVLRHAALNYLEWARARAGEGRKDESTATATTTASTTPAATSSSSSSAPPSAPTSLRSPEEISFTVPLSMDAHLASCSVYDTPLHRLDEKRRAALAQRRSALQTTHDQLAPLDPATHRLARTTCGICGAAFPSRNQLFRCHLDVCHGCNLSRPESRLYGYHARHVAILARGPEGYPTPQCVDEGSESVFRLQCPVCDGYFEASEESQVIRRFRRHLLRFGQVADMEPDENDDEDEEEEEATERTPGPPQMLDAHIEECCVCFAEVARREGGEAAHEAQAMLLPCGHQSFCLDCAQDLRDGGQPCPLCRAPIERVQELGDL